MEKAIYLIALLIAIPVLYPVVWAIRSVYRRYRGTRLVTCPETGQAAAVRVDARQAVMTALAGHQVLELENCSLWQEHPQCGQECLRQIEAAPEACLLRNLLAHWYEGKACVFCHRPLGKAHWMEHPPVLLSPEGRTLEWIEVPPAKIPETLQTHLPVCWDCHVEETFRRLFPEEATHRPQREAETHEMRSSK